MGTKGESTEELEQSFKYVIEKSNNDLEEKGQVESVESVEPTMNQEIRSKDESDKKAHFKDRNGKTKNTDEPIDKTKGLAIKGLEKSGNGLEESEVDKKLKDSEGKEKLHYKKESEEHKGGKPTTNKQTRYNIKDVTVEAATKNLIGIYIPEDQINKRRGESKEDLEQSFKDVIEKSINDLEEKEQVDSVEPTMNQEIRSKDESDKTAHFNDGDGKTKTTDEPIDKTKGLATKGLEKSANELEEREVDQKLEDSEGKEKLRHKKESEKNKAGNPTTKKQTRDDLKEILVESTTKNLIGINIPEDPIYETKGESTEELEQSFKYVIEKSNNDLEEKGQVESIESVEPTMNQEIRSKDESDKTANFKDGDGKTKTTNEPTDRTKGLSIKGLEKSANEWEESEVDEKTTKAGKPTINKQTRYNIKDVRLESTTNNVIGINIHEDPINETKRR